MRDLRVVVAGSDGVPAEIFTSNTARMQADRVAELQEMAADDAIPSEMVGGETTRIEQTALTGLLEKSEGLALGTPKLGLPQLEEPAIQVVEAVEVVMHEPSLPVMRKSRMRDVVVGALLALVVMSAWFCATHV